MDPNDLPDIDDNSEVQLEAEVRKTTVEAKKTQLLTLLQVVCWSNYHFLSVSIATLDLKYEHFLGYSIYKLEGC